MVEAHSDEDERRLKMMRDVIRYIDTNQVEKVNRVLTSGLSIGDPVNQIGGMTATMHGAAVGGNTMMGALMALGPDLGQKDSSGRSALHYACRAGNHKTTKILLAAIEASGNQAWKEIATNGGVTPLMAAV